MWKASAERVIFVIRNKVLILAEEQKWGCRVSAEVLRDTAWAVCFYSLRPEKPAQGSCWVSVLVSRKTTGVSAPRPGVVLVRVASRQMSSIWVKKESIFVAFCDIFSPKSWCLTVGPNIMWPVGCNDAWYPCGLCKLPCYKGYNCIFGVFTGVTLQWCNWILLLPQATSFLVIMQCLYNALNLYIYIKSLRWRCDVHTAILKAAAETVL